MCCLGVHVPKVLFESVGLPCLGFLLSCLLVHWKNVEQLPLLIYFVGPKYLACCLTLYTQFPQTAPLFVLLYYSCTNYLLPCRRV